MLIKRISTALVALFCFCSVAQADVSFNSEKFTIDVDVNVSQDSGEGVIVSVTDATSGEMSGTNLPKYIYPYFTDANGDVVASIALSKTLPSSKYNVMLTGSNINKTYSVNIINDNDDDTKSVLATINSSNNVSDVYKLLTTDNNAIKVGIDLSDKHVSSALNYAVDFVINKRGSQTYTVTTLKEALSLGIVCYDIKNGTDIDSLMEQNAALFGTTYEDYSAIDAKQRDIIKTILSKADYINNDAKAIYTAAEDISAIRTSKAWAYLQEYLLDNAERIGIDIGTNSNYSKIKESNRYKIFQAMYKNISSYNDYSDIIADFNKQVTAVKNEQNTSSKSTSGGGGGGGGGGGSSTSVVATGTVSTTVSTTWQTYLLGAFKITDTDAVIEWLTKLKIEN